MPGMANTMKEWKQGKLHSGSKKGPIVKSQKQAVAIGLSEDRKANKRVVPAPKPNAPHQSPSVKDSQPQMPEPPKAPTRERRESGGTSEAVRSGGHEPNFEHHMARGESMRKHGFDASVHPIEKHDAHANRGWHGPLEQHPDGHHPVVMPHMPANHAHKHGPAPAPLPSHRTSNYGHAAHQRIGHERTSGHSGAHRIGKR